MSVVVITGACGGIGQQLARRYIARGDHVLALGLDEHALSLLSELDPARVRTATPDVTDLSSMRDTARGWIAEFGYPDIVIANAGVAGGFDISAPEDLAAFKRIVDINLIGPMVTFHPFVDGMRDRGSGSLVGIASIAGWRGMPGNAAYCAAKGGLIRALEALRAELRPDGVRVLTISPGYVRTALTAANAMAMPGLLSAEGAAERIMRAIDGSAEKATIPRRTGMISRLLGLLPDRAHDAIVLKQPRKTRPTEPGATRIPGL